MKIHILFTLALVLIAGIASADQPTSRTISISTPDGSQSYLVTTSGTHTSVTGLLTLRYGGGDPRLIVKNDVEHPTLGTVDIWPPGAGVWPVWVHATHQFLYPTEPLLPRALYAQLYPHLFPKAKAPKKAR